MKFYNLIFNHFIAPFYLKRDKRNIYPILEEVNKAQFLTPEEIKKNQLKKLKKIIKYAYDNVPYYQQKYSEIGFLPEDLKSLNDIKRLPILTKDAIREHKMDLVSRKFKPENLIKKRTGGSTSVPLHFFWDHRAATFKYACTIRANNWAGYNMGDKLAAIWGDTDKKINLKQKIRRFLYERVIYLDTLKMDEAYMKQFFARMKRFKPQIMMGHAHSIFVFAEFVASSNIEPPPIKGIISTAEMLYDYEREKIEQVFGKVLFNRYGCEELSIIAAECEEHDGLHINTDGLVVEIIDQKDDLPGKLIITDLVNYGMPFIRYEIGDMATFKEGKCACGRGLPRLGKLYGRTSDFLYTPEGKMISGISVLDTFAIHVPGVKQVQFIQEEIDRLTINIVKDKSFGEQSFNELKVKIPHFFGDKMRYELKFLDKIPQTERGKYRFSICKISPSEIKVSQSGNE